MTWRGSASHLLLRCFNHSLPTTATRITARPCLISAKTMSSDGGKPKVYVTRRVPPRGIELLSAHCELTQWDHDDPVPREELLKNVQGKDALFCLLTDKINDEVLDAAGPNLKVVGTMSVGFDHVDVNACQKRKIPVGFTPEVLTDATAELTVALLLATSRRIIEGHRAVKNGEWGTWKPLWLCGPGLLGSTVGIAGFGRIGYAVAKRLQPFGVKKFVFTTVDPNPITTGLENAHQVDTDTLLQESDFVLAHCALTPETAGMFNLAAFSKMKKTAIFVNTSRGPVVNQDDLYTALTTGLIHGAGLDVTVPEPLPTDHPLLTLDNCLVLPHIASATNETRNAMSELTARNILAALNGEKMPAQVK